MTVEELKSEALKMGYYLRKKPERIEMRKCLCGYELTRHNLRSDRDIGGNIKHFRCPRCRFKGYSGRSIQEAKVQWNRSIIEEELRRHYLT